MVILEFKAGAAAKIAAREKRLAILGDCLRAGSSWPSAGNLFSIFYHDTNRKIVPDQTCKRVCQIIMWIGSDVINEILIGGIPLAKTEFETLAEFATADGFDSVGDFHKFWLGYNGGPGIFRGYLIQWD